MKVTDPEATSWSVYRRWGFRYWHSADDTEGSEADLVIIVVQIVVIAPVWFIAKWFGAPWTIVVERNGTEVAEERVRGWRRSQARIREIAEAAAAGTLDQKIVANVPTGRDLPPEMGVTPQEWAKLTPEARVTLWRMFNSGGLRRR